MVHSSISSAPMEASQANAHPPLLTRGLRREQQKRDRKRARVPAGTLVIGVDLARQQQAVSYAIDGRVLGRRRLRCAPQELDRLVDEAHALAPDAPRMVAAFEPAGHYWCLAAEAFERAGVDYLPIHALTVKRERESTRYTPEKIDPRDADLIACLPAQGKFTECRLPQSRARDALWQLARDYYRVRCLSAAERTRLHNFWHRMLPEFFTVFRDPSGTTALAAAQALPSTAELARLTKRQWAARVRRAAAGKRILLSRAAALLPLLKAAAADPVRRSGDGMAVRIRHAAQRRILLENQKQVLRTELLHRYAAMEEHVFLDSIAGSDPFYNALTLALVGHFESYDDPRAVVKLAGSEVNEYASGDWSGRSRMSHRGRSPLRAAAFQQARQLVAHNPDFRARFYELAHRTHRPRLAELQAYVAIMNSYLRTAHALVTRRELYRSRAERAQEVT